MQQPAARLPARATCGRGSPRRGSASGGSLELVGKYGLDTFTTALRRFMDYGEQVALRALGELPKGRSTLAEEQDSGAVYSVTVEITDDEFVVDLRDNPDQDPGPNNASQRRHDDRGADGLHEHHRRARLRERGALQAAEGADATRLGVRREAAGRVRDLLRGRDPALRPDLALPGAAPRRAAAGRALRARSAAPSSAARTPTPAGTSRSSSRSSAAGAARASATATAPIFSGFHGDTFNCPAEVAEARYGLYVDRLALNDAPGGEGEHRGGKGIVLDYRVRSTAASSPAPTRATSTGPGRSTGGREGSPNYVEVIRADGSVEDYAVVTALEVNEGDVIRIHTGTGGGYGDPRLRPRELVLDDLRNGYLTEEQARDVYGLDQRSVS